MNEGVEALVVFAGDHPVLPPDVAGAVRFLQRVSPRVATVAADADGIARLASLPGVLAVATDGPVADAVLERLDDSERLFAGAWAARQQPKHRPGDGMHWDAPGFSPPDPPGRAHT